MKFKFLELTSAAAFAPATAGALAAGPVSMNGPDSTDFGAREGLTFIAKDSPGVRCNGNLQVTAELASTDRVPISLIPSSLAPHLPAPLVFYGRQMRAADGKEHNGAMPFQMASDVLEVEGVPKQGKEGLLFNADVRRNSAGLKDKDQIDGARRPTLAPRDDWIAAADKVLVL